jgi:hypothetical protein
MPMAWSGPYGKREQGTGTGMGQLSLHGGWALAWTSFMLTAAALLMRLTAAQVVITHPCYTLHFFLFFRCFHQLSTTNLVERRRGVGERRAYERLSATSIGNFPSLCQLFLSAASLHPYVHRAP